MLPHVNFQLFEIHLLRCVTKQSEYQKCSRNWPQNRQKQLKMTTFEFDLEFCECSLFFSDNCSNNDYYDPLASLLRNCSYLEGQSILEILILKLWIIAPENVLKGAIQDISNACIHPNCVQMAFSSDLCDRNFDSR